MDTCFVVNSDFVSLLLIIQMAGIGAVFHNAEQGAKLAAANSKFALELYQRQTAAMAGNIFISPLSISVALSMTYAGARNQTKKQMADVVKFGEVEEQHLHEAFNDLRTSLNKPGQPFKLFMANRLFGEKTYSFLEEFLNLGRKFYGAELAPVNFADNAGAAAIINKWVAENTNNMINDIVPADALNALTRLVLVNAIYFKGDWTKKFDKAHTKTEDFFVSPMETMKVDLMHMRKAKFSYGVNQELNCQAIALPYSGDALSMFILLPDKTVTTLSDLEKKLTADVLLDVESSFRMFEREVHIWLPRFRLDENLELSETLKAMGMIDAFGDKSDFSGMDGSKDLYISKVLHRAVVEVNEEGTEAAAATAVVMMMRCAMIPKDPFEFRADHPFLFFIRDNATKSILFLGRVVKPLKVTAKDEL